MNHFPWSCKGKIRSWPFDLGMGKVKRHLECESSFSNYNRIHWVVCKTQQWQGDIERFMRDIWGGEERAASWAQFPRELGHISQRNFLFKRGWYLLLWGGHTEWICTARKRAQISKLFMGRKFEADWSVSCCWRGHTVLSVHLTVGMHFELLYS